MNSDSYFKIGHTHDVCQDYAISNNNGEKSFAVMSDGCSGSPMTDFGSRFLCLGTAQVLNEDAKTEEEIDGIPDLGLRIAQIISQAAGLPAECLDATLGYVFIDGENIIAFLSGDGAVAARKKDGTKICEIVEYPSGAPPYLSYTLNGDRKKLYLSKTNGCECMVESWEKIDKKFNKKYLEENKGFEKHVFLFPKDQFDLVMVMSDGISSFQKQVIKETTKYYEQVHPTIIIDRLLDVKSFTGSFIKRRCKRLFKNIEQDGLIHLDDFSVAAIHV